MTSEKFNALDAYRAAKVKHDTMIAQFDADYGFDSGIITRDSATYHHIDSLISIQKTTLKGIELSLRKLAEQDLIQSNLFKSIQALSHRKMNNIIKATSDMSYYSLDEYFNPVSYLFSVHNDEKAIKAKDKDIISTLLQACLPQLKHNLEHFIDFNANTLYSRSGFVSEVCDMLGKIALHDDLSQSLPINNHPIARTKI